jgi:hypothetical protein
MGQNFFFSLDLRQPVLDETTVKPKSNIIISANIGNEEREREKEEKKWVTEKINSNTTRTFCQFTLTG